MNKCALYKKYTIHKLYVKSTRSLYQNIFIFDFEINFMDLGMRGGRKISVINRSRIPWKVSSKNAFGIGYRRTIEHEQIVEHKPNH